MKRLSLKVLLILVVVSLSAGIADAQTTKSGTGCYLDTSTGQKIFTKKLGRQKWYENNYDVYSNSVDVYKVAWSNPQCNEATVSGSFGNCWVNSQVNSANNSSGAQWGTLMNYTVTTCPPVNVPLDDYIWLVMLIVMGLGTFHLSKNKFAVIA